MSCNYADGLSPYENKGVLGLAEKYDSTEKLKLKCDILTGWINESRHVVVHTGAGISTSAGISDFRGPYGVWTLERKGLKPEKNMAFDKAVPTKTHMALKKLIEIDDEEQLRARNNSSKRIMTIKSKSTPYKKRQSGNAAASHVEAKKKKKGLKHKNAGKQRKADRENVVTANSKASSFYCNLGEISSDEECDQDLPADDNNQVSPPPPPSSVENERDSMSLSPLPPELGAENKSSSEETEDSANENEGGSPKVDDLLIKLAAQEKEIKSLKQNLVTKKLLQDSLKQVHEEMSRKKEDRGETHRGPLNHPPLNSAGEVQITNDFCMLLKAYLSALNAPDMRKREIRVMSILWTEERREKLLVERDPKRPDLEVVTDEEYRKIILCLTLQNIKCLEYREQDDVILHIRYWTSIWLKNWKPNKKCTRRRQNPRI
ncbi:uncharacterized protein LOC141532128 isoform X2 [Cotesia typhae]|uniref:uncharacterized protein LOC141532128 isoform X2 n=1 Tax=Cotesia typhae TaxID=2053667 RepID=UPI003D69DD44